MTWLSLDVAGASIGVTRTVNTKAKPKPKARRARLGLRETKKQRTRSELVLLALKLFQEQGFDATSMEQIAHDATVSPGTVYNYFPTKKDLLSAVYERMFRGIMVGVPEIAIDEEDTPLTVLRRLLEYTYHELGKFDRRLLNHIYFLVLSDGDVYEMQANDHHSQSEAHFRAIVDALIASGLLKPETDVALLATALFNISYAEFRRYTYHRRADTGEAIEMTLKQFALLLDNAKV